jgi:fatty acid desaturase
VVKIVVKVYVSDVTQVAGEKIVTPPTATDIRAASAARRGSIPDCLALFVTGAMWLASFPLMAQPSVLLDVVGVWMCAHGMVLAAYLVHEAAHQSLFATPRTNHWVGEVMNFIAGTPHASFERIRHMHIRHHVERVDLTCFDPKELLRTHPRLRRVLEALEWAYVPGVEVLMRLQLICRPVFMSSQRHYLPRALGMFLLRAGLLVLLGLYCVKAVLLYGVAVLLQMRALNFFDAFHHTFEQYRVLPDEPIPLNGRTRAYEQDNTYSNLISTRSPWLNLLVLNFVYHNAHHHRPSVPWWRLPAVHRSLYGDNDTSALLTSRELLATWHRNRVRRVFAESYGAVGAGPRRGDTFIGAHGASFLTVV